MQLNQTNISRIFVAIFFIVLSIWVYGLLNFVETISLEPNKNLKRTDAIILIKSNDLKLETALNIFQQDKSENLIISGIPQGTNLGMLLSNSLAITRQTYKYLMKMKLIHCCKDLSHEVAQVAEHIKKNKYKSVSLVAYNHDIRKIEIALKRKLNDIEIDLIPAIEDQFIIENWWKVPHMKRLIIKSYNTYLLTKFGFKLI